MSETSENSTRVTPEAVARIEQLKRQYAQHRADGARDDDRLAQAKLNVQGKLRSLGVDPDHADAIMEQIAQATLAAYDSGRHMAYRVTAKIALRDQFGIEVDA